MSPEDAVAIVHPGDAIIWPLPPDTTMQQADEFKDGLRTMFDPIGVRVNVATGPALVVIRGYEAAATPIYDELVNQ